MEELRSAADARQEEIGISCPGCGVWDGGAGR